MVNLSWFAFLWSGACFRRRGRCGGRYERGDRGWHRRKSDQMFSPLSRLPVIGTSESLSAPYFIVSNRGEVAFWSDFREDLTSMGIGDAKIKCASERIQQRGSFLAKRVRYFAGSWWTAMPAGSGLLAGKNPGFRGPERNIRAQVIYSARLFL